MQGLWQEHGYGGYRPKAVDLTAYWRPALHRLKSKHYHPGAGKALPAVVLGIVTRVGSLNGQRVAVMSDLLCADLHSPSETTLKKQLLH